ncbi:MAG: ribosome assembly factor SBDS [Nanoarchaeota archaeon]|nr:ribosome assembly factor SBDS [Nanoarchaeota archaeon]MBU1644053.1 ribosome assembly factor SBDS [Nanoarchaeota archaeon]MBU1977295.1 ribosome assembly factor SBDS [Nanoarchaeota archaeon]
MEEKINLARIKKFGHNFEISIDPDTALEYKKGKVADLREVLLANNVFTDAKKGLIASEEKLEEAFKTTDVNVIADYILKYGEIQSTSEHRSAEREQAKKKLIQIIHKQAVDPKTGFPHPPNRIEAALEQGKINLDYNRTVEEQFEEIISKLRPIIPIKIEQKRMTLTIPAEYIGKIYQWVKNNAKILNENWTNSGEWEVKVEVPAGFQQEFIDHLNSLTHGNTVVENE